MATKSPTVSLEPVSEIPQSASVCHFDEIEDALQEAVVSVQNQEQSTVTVSPSRAQTIDECSCDIIKFTEYYQVNRN